MRALPILHPGFEPRVTVARRASRVSAKWLADSLEAPGEHFGGSWKAPGRWVQTRAAPTPALYDEVRANTPTLSVLCPALSPNPYSASHAQRS